MRSPLKPYFDSDNPQQDPSIPYPSALNNSFFFLIPLLSPVIFLYILSTSLLISLILLLLEKVLYFVCLSKTLSFLHWLIVNKVLKLLLVHFELKQLFVYRQVTLSLNGSLDKFLNDEAL